MQFDERLNEMICNILKFFISQTLIKKMTSTRRHLINLRKNMEWCIKQTMRRLQNGLKVMTFGFV